MSLKIILDGYNVIHKISYLADFLQKDLASAREALIRMMVDWRRSQGVEVVIVFDRTKDALAGIPVCSSQKMAEISCIFTAPGIEADDQIISFLKREKNPAHVTVVSADGKVVNNCKALGVRAVPPSFLVREPVKRGKPSSQASEIKSLSPARENDITRWYMEQLRK